MTTTSKYQLTPQAPALIYKGDCNALLADMPSGSVDLFLCDPPYGIDFKSKVVRNPAFNRPAFKRIANDKKPYTVWLQEAYRVLKPGGRLICFYHWDVQEEFAQAIKAAGFKLKDQVVWDKMAHGSGDLTGGYGPQHELMFYAVKGRYRFRGKRPKSVYRHMKVNSQNLVHPNEKPLSLLVNIIDDLTLPGETVGDLFGGSFSTLEAALVMDRYCVTAELDEHYYNKGIERLRLRPFWFKISVLDSNLSAFIPSLAA